MPDLTFAVSEAAVLHCDGHPLLGLSIELENASPGEAISSVILRCQLRLECPRRRYTDKERERLKILFGEPEQWSETMRSLTLASTAGTVNGFSHRTRCQLLFRCGERLAGAASYLNSLDDDATAPLLLLFSGSVFHNRGDKLQVAPIPWDREARFSLPLSVWRSVSQ